VEWYSKEGARRKMTISGLSAERREHLETLLKNGFVAHPAEYNRTLDVYDIKLTLEGASGFVVFTVIAEELEDTKKLIKKYAGLWPEQYAGIPEK